MATMTNIFNKGFMDQDSHPSFLQKGMIRELRNGQILNATDRFVAKKLKGTTDLYSADEAAQTIVGIHYYNRHVLLFFKGTYGKLYEYDLDNGTGQKLYEGYNLIHDKSWEIKDIDVVDDRHIYFIDGVDYPKMIDKIKALNGEYTDSEIFVTSPKPPAFEPTLSYNYIKGSEPTYLKNSTYRFAYRYNYYDGRQSPLSFFTEPAFDTARGFNKNGEMNNVIKNVDITVDTGSKFIKSIDVVGVDGFTNVGYFVNQIDKEDEQLGDNSNYTFNFDNSKIYTAVPQSVLDQYYDNTPYSPQSQALIDNRLFYTDYKDGFDLVNRNNQSIKPNITFSSEVFAVHDYTEEAYADKTSSIQIEYDFSVSPLSDLDWSKVDTVCFEFHTKREADVDYQAHFFWKVTGDYVDADDFFSESGILDEMDTFIDGANASWSSNYSKLTITIDDTKTNITFGDQNYISIVDNPPNGKNELTNNPWGSYDHAIAYYDTYNRLVGIIYNVDYTTGDDYYSGYDARYWYDVSINHLPPKDAVKFRLLRKNLNNDKFVGGFNAFTDGTYIYLQPLQGYEGNITKGDVLRHIPNNIRDDSWSITVLEIARKDSEFVGGSGDYVKISDVNNDGFSIYDIQSANNKYHDNFVLEQKEIDDSYRMYSEIPKTFSCLKGFHEGNDWNQEIKEIDLTRVYNIDENDLDLVKYRRKEKKELNYIFNDADEEDKGLVTDDKIIYWKKNNGFFPYRDLVNKFVRVTYNSASLYSEGETLYAYDSTGTQLGTTSYISKDDVEYMYVTYNSAITWSNVATIENSEGTGVTDVASTAIIDPWTTEHQIRITSQGEYWKWLSIGGGILYQIWDVEENLYIVKKKSELSYISEVDGHRCLVIEEKAIYTYDIGTTSWVLYTGDDLTNHNVDAEIFDFYQSLRNSDIYFVHEYNPYSSDLLYAISDGYDVVQREAKISLEGIDGDFFLTRDRIDSYVKTETLENGYVSMDYKTHEFDLSSLNFNNIDEVELTIIWHNTSQDPRKFSFNFTHDAPQTTASDFLTDSGIVEKLNGQYGNTVNASKSGDILIVEPAVGHSISGGTFYYFTGSPASKELVLISRKKDIATAKDFINTYRSYASIDFKKKDRYASATWTNIFERTTNYNGLGNFNLTLTNYKDFDRSRGHINGIINKMGDMILMQDYAIMQVPVNKDIVRSADGSQSLSLSTNVLGKGSSYSTEYGLTSSEAVTDWQHRIYFVDKYRNAILRLSRNGVAIISNAGMENYFDGKIKSHQTKSIDYRVRNYVATVDALWGIESEQGDKALVEDTNTIYLYDQAMWVNDTDLTTLSGSANIYVTSTSTMYYYNSHTISPIKSSKDIYLDFDPSNDEVLVNFDDEVASFKDSLEGENKGWTKFYDITPERMVNDGYNLYSVVGKTLYEHGTGNLNSFYGSPKEFKLSFVVNDKPNMIKELQSLSIYKDPIYTKIYNDEQNFNTEILEANFENKKGKYFAYVPFNQNENLRDFDAIGAGTVKSVNSTANEVTMNSIDYQMVDTGDTVYNYTQDNEVGEVTGITGNDKHTLQFASFTNEPAVDHLLIIYKQKIIEGEPIKANYWLVEMTDSTSNQKEIYMVESEVVESFV